MPASRPVTRSRGPTSARSLVAAFLISAALAALPLLAVQRTLGAPGLAWAAGWMMACSLFAFGTYHADRRRAQSGSWRVPESTLHLLAVAGGWPGAFLAQRLLRHKNAKLSFQFVFWALVAVHQFLAIDALRGWPMVRTLF